MYLAHTKQIDIEHTWDASMYMQEKGKPYLKTQEPKLHLQMSKWIQESQVMFLDFQTKTQALETLFFPLLFPFILS